LAKRVFSTAPKRLATSRVWMLVASMLLAVLLASEVALAATIDRRGGVCVRTNSKDTLYGSPKVDVEFGLGGKDKLFGRAGNDDLHGGPGSDWWFIGGKGHDVNFAGPGDDSFLTGDDGDDVVSGGPGVDTLIDGPWPGDSAVDTLKGGDDDDFLDAENRTAAIDIVDCGAGGHDIAVVDRMDMVADDCERTW
jgi:hypothetical protein